MLSFRSNYTDALLTGSFGIGHSIESVLNELLDLGLTLESLSGVDKKLADVAENNPHIEYAAVTDLTGLVLFHNDQMQRGQKYSDPVTLKTLSSNVPLWQVYNLPDGAGRYDVAVPIFLENALSKEEFEIYYQPKVDMYSCDVIGVEALIRWMHPETGLTLPGDFL
jgi:selenophosphate synthase